MRGCSQQSIKLKREEYHLVWYEICLLFHEGNGDEIMTLGIAMKFLTKNIFCFILCFLTSIPMAMAASQDIAAINQAVKNYLETTIQVNHSEKLQVTVGHLDSRLRLTACDKPLDIFQPYDNHNLQTRLMGVKCSGTQPWRIYIPVKIQLYQPIVVSAIPLTKGIALNVSDLRLEERDIAQLRQGFFSDLSQLDGKVLKQSVMAGKAIAPTMLSEPIAVKRGQLVDIMAIKDTLQVRMSGIALQKGSVGDIISVRNKSSKRVVEGEVTTKGVVQIRLSG